MGSLAARTTQATARTRTWGGGRSQTSARIVGRHRSVADMFWRFEDLWQSPTGDISHAVKLPVDRTLRPPEIPVYRQARCRGGGYAIETATYTPTVTSVVVASQLDGEWIDEQRSDPAFVASLAPGWRCRR